MIVVSGADGVILWKTYSQEYNMASPLSLQTSHYHQDAFLYQLVGRTGKKVNDVNGAIHGIGAQRNVSRWIATEVLIWIEYRTIFKSTEYCQHYLQVYPWVMCYDIIN